MIGLFYIPCENSKHWDASLFYTLQKNVVFKNTSSTKIIMMSDFNARTGKKVLLILMTMKTYYLLKKQG